MKRESQWYRAETGDAARRHALDPDLIEAVVIVESSGLTHAYRFEPGFWQRYLLPKAEWKDMNPRRVSASYGLMQVMFPVAVELGYEGEPEGLFAPAVGLEYGCRKIAELLAWSGGNEDQALAAYNGGRGGNDRPPYRNAHYVTKVRAALLQVRHGAR